MKYIKYFEAYESYEGYDFNDDHHDYNNGQSYATLRMYDNNKNLLAYIDYVLYKGKVTVNFVESIIKGKGYGFIIMKYLSKLYGYENIERTGTTDDGEKLVRKLDKFYNFDYKTYKDSLNRHLNKNVLEKIKDIFIKQFLIDLCDVGYKEAWGKFSKTKTFMDLRNNYDFNDIASISEWIKGSKTNENDPETDVPDYILEQLKLIS